jgi:hypothetical protein
MATTSQRDHFQVVSRNASQSAAERAAVWAERIMLGSLGGRWQLANADESTR